LKLNNNKKCNIMNKYAIILFASLLVMACGKRDKAVDIANEYIELTEKQLGGIQKSPLFGEFPFYYDLLTNTSRNIQIGLNREKDEIRRTASDEEKWGEIYQLSELQQRARVCADSLIKIKMSEVVEEYDGKDVPVEYDKTVFGKIEAKVKAGDINTLLPEIFVEFEVLHLQPSSQSAGVSIFGQDEVGMTISTHRMRKVKEDGLKSTYVVPISDDGKWLYGFAVCPN